MRIRQLDIATRITKTTSTILSRTTRRPTIIAQITRHIIIIVRNVIAASKSIRVSRDRSS